MCKKSGLDQNLIDFSPEVQKNRKESKNTWPIYKSFKATWGVSFSLVFTYVVALLILFPKWAHLPLNSKRLLRYDSSKLGHFRPFSSICIGKSPKFAYKFLHFFKNLSHQILQLTPNLVSTLRDIKSRNACNGILIF